MLRTLLQRLMDGGSDGGGSSMEGGSVERLLAAARCGGAGAAAAAGAAEGHKSGPAVQLVLPADAADAEPYGGEGCRGRGSPASSSQSSSSEAARKGGDGGEEGSCGPDFDLAALATALSTLPARLLAATLRGSALGPRGLADGSQLPRLPPVWLRGGPAPLLALCRALAAKLELQWVADAAMRDAAAALLRVAMGRHALAEVSASAYTRLVESEAFFASGPEPCSLEWAPEAAAPPPRGDKGDSAGGGERAQVVLGGGRDEPWRRARLLRAAIDVAAACRALGCSSADATAAGGATRRTWGAEAPVQTDPCFWRRLVADYHKSARPEGWELLQQHVGRQASDSSTNVVFWGMVGRPNSAHWWTGHGQS